MGATRLLLVAVALWSAGAASARASDLVTRPHATRPLSDSRAARLVHRSRFEPRPANRAATHRRPSAAQLRAFRAQSDMPYARYVTGRFTGTTDEVIQWAARKWGFRPDLLRAVATVESWWRMSTVGGSGDSSGLFQVRRPFHCQEPVCAVPRRRGAQRRLLRRDSALLLRRAPGLAQHGVRRRAKR